jgi:hypothetical protein
MKRNTILTHAVILALGYGGTAAAQDSQECVDSAIKLSAEIAQSTMADAAKAELMKALSDAQAADFVRCAQVVTRVQLAAGTTRDQSADEDYRSANDDTSPAVESAGYEQGHASADAALASHPGAAANDSSDESLSASGDVQQGYASPQATMQSPSIAAEKGSGTNFLSSMSATDLIDRPVQKAAGEKLGEIDAIVTDRAASARGYAVIGFAWNVRHRREASAHQPRSIAGHPGRHDPIDRGRQAGLQRIPGVRRKEFQDVPGRHRAGLVM